MKRIYGVPSILGGQNFYDESGNPVGYSVPSVFGGENYYGEDGETGYSVNSPFGGFDYYGSEGTMESPYGSFCDSVFSE